MISTMIAVAALSFPLTSLEYSPEQCMFLELIQENITEMKAEGYGRQYVLEGAIAGDGETSTWEDKLYIEEAVNRVYDGKTSDTLCIE